MVNQSTVLNEITRFHYSQTTLLIYNLIVWHRFVLHTKAGKSSDDLAAAVCKYCDIIRRQAVLIKTDGLLRFYNTLKI